MDPNTWHSRCWRPTRSSRRESPWGRPGGTPGTSDWNSWPMRGCHYRRLTNQRAELTCLSPPHSCLCWSRAAPATRWPGPPPWLRWTQSQESGQACRPPVSPPSHWAWCRLELEPVSIVKLTQVTFQKMTHWGCSHLTRVVNVSHEPLLRIPHVEDKPSITKYTLCHFFLTHLSTHCASLTKWPHFTLIL